MSISRVQVCYNGRDFHFFDSAKNVTVRQFGLAVLCQMERTHPDTYRFLEFCQRHPNVWHDAPSRPYRAPLEKWERRGVFSTIVQ